MIRCYEDALYHLGICYFSNGPLYVHPSPAWKCMGFQSPIVTGENIKYYYLPSYEYKVVHPVNLLVYTTVQILYGSPHPALIDWNLHNALLPIVIKLANILLLLSFGFSQMALNPIDTAICCFVGKELFRLMTKTETDWQQYGFREADGIHFTCVCWLCGDRYLLYTSNVYDVLYIGILFYYYTYIIFYDI